MALWDAEGRILGEPVWRLLGSATPPESVRAYANINRACIDRTPEAFAELAIRAIRDGFVTVKLAPFDNSTADEGRRSIEAVRAAVGDGIEILVDCHHRLTAEQLSDLMPSLEATNVGWLEDIPSEVQTRLPIAGGELFTTEEEIAAADLDWFLPDVKHAGGIAPSLALVKAALRRGCRIAPHNPTGPVATAASLQLAALFESDVVLEFQYGETAARPSPEFGRLPIPRGPGLGLDSAAFE
jgi:galactonate dehydratase